jgi:hypothetical protein
MLSTTKPGELRSFYSGTDILIAAHLFRKGENETSYRSYGFLEHTCGISFNRPFEEDFWPAVEGESCYWASAVRFRPVVLSSGVRVCGACLRLLVVRH